ncbi:TPA: hypothetical protein CPT87_05065 [Candidatus Gastranaerophilales bacterium HUM_5]|nr:MAG TPA: hypothetical protein CPT99_02105 [Candidatus Gastranaerophilales bacterium HUM_4]DAA90589.1 MAG TPA: hypothetical protein CPT87_05065 [Candidatus Gastranaerophilales bacterium HUM_5]
MDKMDILFKSDGWQAIYKMGYYAEIFAIFVENYRELMKAITEIQTSKEPILAHFSQTHLSRYLFNFLASATALKGNCYVLMENYKNAELWEKYKEATKKYFLNNELVAFINDFRNYQTHYKVEISYISTKNQVVFDTCKLLEHPKQWNTLAKRFIKNAGTEIVLQEVCEKYYQLNEEFCLWLINELNLFHREDIKRIKDIAKSSNIDLSEIYEQKLYALQHTPKIAL